MTCRALTVVEVVKWNSSRSGKVVVTELQAKPVVSWLQLKLLSGSEQVAA